MKVLATIVVPPHMSVSGGARAAELLSSALTEHCDITVASMMNGTGNVDGGGKQAARIPVRSWLPPLVPWSRLSNRYSTLFYRSDLPDIVRRGAFDLVHIHNPMPALEMERVARACLAAGTPYVVSTHGFNEVANGGDIYRFDTVRRQLWKQLVQAPVSRVVARASGIFALSEADFEIVRNMGYTGSELSVVTNGVAVPEPADAAADAPLLERAGIPVERVPGEIACMFLANHTPNKGLPVLLEAFAALERPYLLIVGGETRGDVDYDAYVRRCRPGQQIVVTGRLSDAEVAAALRRTDLFVFPTLADTFPLVVLEAMAHGRAVLASEVGGIPHQLTSECGRLVPPGDAAALRTAIDGLAAEPERLAAMGAHAHTRAVSKFSWAAAAGHAAAAYQRVLQQHAPARRHQPVSALEARWAGE
ncbi:glycosyltransferase family 4 protein [Hyphomicrobium sp.]|uniref:glycosyltransferase family 4 protein n=1 Tax=Hyphomicrobium sp. TaxID=82 RepID=UPI0025C212B3|nr:glycosyltransferase family 4 protein [Hyphomicrobium sp.]MCC7250779.1 glycosyltransferase family 4 protein [Hyphomicrobium sp.]